MLWTNIIWFPLPLEIQIKLPLNTPPPFIAMRKPRVHTKISTHSLKAEFHIIIFVSILWIAFELAWAVDCLAMSMHCLFVLFSQFPHTHKYTCIQTYPKGLKSFSPKESICYFLLFLLGQKFSHVDQFRQYFIIIYSKGLRLSRETCILQFSLKNIHGSILLSVYTTHLILKYFGYYLMLCAQLDLFTVIILLGKSFLVCVYI